MENLKLVKHGLALTSLVLVIISHYILFIVLAASIPLMIINLEWYIWVPLGTWVVRLPFVEGICPLTSLESKLRVMTGRPAIKSFIKQNILKPYVKTKIYIRKISKEIR